MPVIGIHLAVCPGRQLCLVGTVGGLARLSPDDDVSEITADVTEGELAEIFSGRREPDWRLEDE